MTRSFVLGAITGALIGLSVAMRVEVPQNTTLGWAIFGMAMIVSLMNGVIDGRSRGSSESGESGSDD